MAFCFACFYTQDKYRSDLSSKYSGELSLYFFAKHRLSDCESISTRLFFTRKIFQAPTPHTHIYTTCIKNTNRPSFANKVSDVMQYFLQRIQNRNIVSDTATLIFKILRSVTATVTVVEVRSSMKYASLFLLFLEVVPSGIVTCWPG